MATISKEFDGAALLGDDTTVRVDATSRVDGAPTGEPASTAIYVMIVDLPGHPPLVGQPEPGDLDSSWSVRFEDSVPPLGKGQRLHLVGIALSPDLKPFIWEGFETIEPK
ncbi:MAG: hypothetical protein QOG94_328 [Solirubrobacteraceae bacterium]|nr:hypothetical protein [Solirubrobacteraceae bacterium]